MHRADSASDARRRLRAQPEGGNGTAAQQTDASLPSSLRFLEASAPGWVLQDPVVQAALEGERSLYTGEDPDDSGSSDEVQAAGHAAAPPAPPAQPGAPAPAPGDADGWLGPAPGPGAELPALPENKGLRNGSMPLATRAMTTGEGGADAGTIAAWCARRASELPGLLVSWC